MPTSPGTVSKILWHFPGGPIWDETKKKQSETAKPASDAYKALVGILKDSELRLGGYKEVVSVVMPTLRSYDRKKREYVVKTNVRVTLTSAPVCCLADIPIAHLGYHAQRYGNFALGFHRDAAIKHEFNPVLYSLHHADVMRLIYKGYAELRDVNVDSVKDAHDDYVSAVADARCEKDHEVEIDLIEGEMSLDSAADAIEESVETARMSFKQMLAFVKTFESDEFPTIYCEREWRSVKCFDFSKEDVAMIVLPKAGGFFEKFAQLAVKLRLPRAIPIVPWEDLIEH